MQSWQASALYQAGWPSQTRGQTPHRQADGNTFCAAAAAAAVLLRINFSSAVQLAEVVGALLLAQAQAQLDGQPAGPPSPDLAVQLLAPPAAQLVRPCRCRLHPCSMTGLSSWPDPEPETEPEPERRPHTAHSSPRGSSASLSWLPCSAHTAQALRNLYMCKGKGKGRG